jgi:hypothetical protein
LRDLQQVGLQLLEDHAYLVPAIDNKGEGHIVEVEGCDNLGNDAVLVHKASIIVLSCCSANKHDAALHISSVKFLEHWFPRRSIASEGGSSLD